MVPLGDSKYLFGVTGVSFGGSRVAVDGVGVTLRGLEIHMGCFKYLWSALDMFGWFGGTFGGVQDRFEVPRSTYPS